MGIQWKKYRDLQAWVRHNGRWKHTVLDSTVYWERKRDGSNMSLLFHKGFPMFYTHYQKTIPDVEVELRKLLKPYMKDLEAMLGENLQLYFELLREGKSPAQFEINTTRHFKAFDIWDIEGECFVHPEEKHRLFKMFHIPHTAIYMTTEPKTIEHFEKMIDDMIEVAYTRTWEGFVAKWWYKGDQYAVKVKTEHKYGKPPKARKKRDKDTRAILERSEVTGAIDCVYNEIGKEKFMDVKIAMPLVARGVSREEKKHGKKNRINLYAEYLTYLGNINANV